MLKDWLAPDEQGGMAIPFHPVHLHRGVLSQLTQNVSPCVNRTFTKPILASYPYLRISTWSRQIGSGFFELTITSAQVSGFGAYVSPQI
jgi:hypothetical protein